MLSTNQDKLGGEREFKEICQNLRKFGSSKKEFRFQAVEALLPTDFVVKNLAARRRASPIAIAEAELELSITQQPCQFP